MLAFFRNAVTTGDLGNVWCELCLILVRRFRNQLSCSTLSIRTDKTEHQMPDPRDDINPYKATGGGLVLESHKRSTRPSARLSTMAVMAGLVLASLVFGISFTACMIFFERLAVYLVGSSPLGAPSGSMIKQAAGVFSVLGFAASLPAMPLLLLCNSKSRLRFGSAFAIMAFLGSVAFIAIATASSPLRPLTPLGPISSKVITFACVIWLPALIAGVAYGLWINTLQKRTAHSLDSARD